jgi:hypothetical protein
LRTGRAGNAARMATLQVLPRPTPAERPDTELEIDVDEPLSDYAELIEGWVAPRQSWEFTLHEGHEFGKTNNVEGRLLFAEGEHTSSLVFRLDQLDRVDDTGEQLVLIFEEKDGIAKLVRCTATGLDVELHHILTFT